MASALPETSGERHARYRRLAGQGQEPSAWERPLRRSDLRASGPDAPDGPILAARVADIRVKDALVADDPDVYFTTPHFNGYPAILVRLDRIDSAELRELLVEAWLARAPKTLGPRLPRRAAVKEVMRARATPSARESVLGDLPCLVMGSGPPLALLGGLTPENGLPRSGPLGGWRSSTMMPFVEDFEVFWVARRRGLAKGTTMADLAADVADALAARFEQPVDVLGISTGGSIAQQLAADHPTAVRRLALVSTACRLENPGRRFQQEMAALAHEGGVGEVFARFARDLVPPRRGRAAAGAVMAWLGPLAVSARRRPRGSGGRVGGRGLFRAAESLRRSRRRRWSWAAARIGSTRRRCSPRPRASSRTRPLRSTAARPHHRAQRPGRAWPSSSSSCEPAAKPTNSLRRLRSMPTRTGNGHQPSDRDRMDGRRAPDLRRLVGDRNRLAAARRRPALGW